MTKLEIPRGKLVRLIKSGDPHFAPKVGLNRILNEMVEEFPFPNGENTYDIKEINNWFNEFLRLSQIYNIQGSCNSCDYYSTDICEECIKCIE